MKFAAAVGLLVLCSFAVPSTETTHQEVTVKRSPTPNWIEVYHDGVLTSEWQPSDGAVYRGLDLLLDDRYYPSHPAPARRDLQERTLLASKLPVAL